MVTMGKKSYSRQAMQKFVFEDQVSVSAGTGLTALSFQIPEEVIIKRIVLNSCLYTSTSQVGQGNFIASVCQNDSFNPALTDATDENRLVRSAAGTPYTPINLDHTITMRKLAGSGISVILNNVGGTDEGYYVKLTLHYLEV